MPMLTGEKQLPEGAKQPRLASGRLGLGLLMMAGAAVFLFIRFF